MKEKFLKILLNPKYIFGVYLIISIVTAISKYNRGAYAINNFLIFKSVFFGGAFLVLADTAARTVVAPAELSIGVLTAFIGAPFFIAVMRSTRAAEL